jgi:Alpha/beta hydrolase domain
LLYERSFTRISAQASHGRAGFALAAASRGRDEVIPPNGSRWIMRKENVDRMIVGLPGRLSRIAAVSATVLALAPAGATSVQASTTARASDAGGTARAAAVVTGPRERVPSPVVTGPIAGGAHGRPFTSAPVPLGLAGYTQQEYFIKGTATGYSQVGTWGTNGRWQARPAETAPYQTRILVRRPVSPARFNGTVVVEWLNVSFNVDIDPDFLYESQQLLRAGYAWVGVSAQQLGVEGPIGLKNWDPARYHALSHPGDTFSYSIFSQAAESLLHPNGPNPLGRLHPKALIADGESQSAARMVTYANAIQPLDRLFDGFLIHSRGASGAAISQAPQTALPMPAVARIRTGLGVPVLTVETETDILASGLGYFPATQPDSHSFRLWELPGTSHVDSTELGLSATEVLRDVPFFPQGACRFQPNDGQERYLMDAALARLNEWVRAGVSVPHAPHIDIQGGAYVTDTFGNALGGVRSPAVDAPISALTGTGNTGGSPVCFLLGTTTPLGAAQLSALYPLHSDYVAAVAQSAARDVRRGFLLSPDALQIDQAAAASQVGLPAPTG